jgi:hypothetical protein
MKYRQTDLEAYLDEALPPEEMAGIEKSMRKDGDLVQQLAVIHARRNAGGHSLGEIWRQHRLSCPSREQLGSYLSGAAAGPLAEYIAFHVQVVGCRYCQANLTDLQTDQAEPVSHARRRKIFESSAGYLQEGGKSRHP